jgi:hypothetical protein
MIEQRYWSYWAYKSSNHTTWRWIIFVLSSLAVALPIFYGQKALLAELFLASFD